VWDGIIFLDSKIRIGQVSDGLSNTVIVGERPPSKDLEFGWWFAGAGYDNSGVGDVIMGSLDVDYATYLGGTCKKLANKDTWKGFQPGDLNNTCDQTHFWSLHSGGGNWLFGDGSARFISYSIPQSTLNALVTREGGEVISGDF
jgi:prepilin-type processing-associated H-X9-DG protein